MEFAIPKSYGVWMSIKFYEILLFSISVAIATAP